jgi:pilus assembly protein Flp/PilA
MDLHALLSRVIAFFRPGRGEAGASLVEYGLLVALIAIVCIAAVTLLGTSASTQFSSVGINV